MTEKAGKILWMALSLLLAVVFWVYVDYQEGNTISREFTNVPIDFIGAEDTLPSRGLMLAEGGDATLDLTIRGPRTVISGLRPGDLRAQVNLTDISAVGSYSKTWTSVTPDYVNNSDITIERQSRRTVTVQVASLYSREVPIIRDIMGAAPENYLYLADRVAVEPAVLTLSGLRENVDRVASARVVVDITGATGTISQEFGYQLLDGDGAVVEDPDVRVSDPRVSVTVPIYLIKELDLELKFRESAGSRLANADWRLEPDTITVAGEPLSLETIDKIVLGEVDLSAHEGDFEEDLDVKIPAGCENISGYRAARLTVRYHGLETRRFTVTNIRAVGLSESQRFDPITTAVEVVLRGPAGDLELVTEEDIRVVVDLTEIAADGTVQPQAAVLVDGWSEVGAVGDYTVTGKIISR